MAVVTYVFKLKTKSGSTMANVLQNGSDQRDAERKLEQKHPGCTILEVRPQR